MPWYKRIFNRRKKAKPLNLRSYAGAQKGRLFADFFSNSKSADAELAPALRTLRDRSRELARNDSYVKRYLALLSANVVGTKGIRLSCKARDDNGQLDLVGNQIIEREFAKWCKKDNCTVTGKLSFIDAQKLFIETLARDGECLVKHVKTKDNPFNYSIQFIEADHLDEELTEVAGNNNKIRMGVECNPVGRPLAYHLFKNHPYDNDSYAVPGKKYTRIPADEIIHAYMQERPEMTRGVPWTATAMDKIHTLNGYRQAELTASRLAACKMGFYTSPGGDGYVGEDYEDTYSPIMEAEPGTFEQLPSGMDFKSFEPNHPTSAFDAFEKAILRGISSGLNISYHSLANDLSSVNYSSIRAGSLEDRAQFGVIQEFVIAHFIEPVFREWLEMAMTTNQIPLPMTRFDKFAESATFIPRSWSYVDPQKEIQANILGLKSGQVTMSDIQSTYGRDVEELFEQHDREKKLAEQYGVSTAFQPFGAQTTAVEPEIQGQDDE
jgi:lambda family phage portal protein